MVTHGGKVQEGWRRGMDEVFSTHAAGCKIYPPEGQNIQISDAVELMSLSQQLLALCTRMSAKIDPAADFLVQRAAARVAAVNRARAQAPGGAPAAPPVEVRSRTRQASSSGAHRLGLGPQRRRDRALGLRATSIVGRRGPATSMSPRRAGKRPCAPKPEDGGLIANGRRCGVTSFARPGADASGAKQSANCRRGLPHRSNGPTTAA